MTMMMFGCPGNAAAWLGPVNANNSATPKANHIQQRFIAGGFGSQRNSANFPRLGKRGNCLKIPEEAGEH